MSKSEEIKDPNKNAKRIVDIATKEVNNKNLVQNEKAKNLASKNIKQSKSE